MKCPCVQNTLLGMSLVLRSFDVNTPQIADGCLEPTANPTESCDQMS